MEEIQIKHTDPSQKTEATLKVAREISEILTSTEEILYIANQNMMALSPKKDAVVVTSNRIILYKPQILGRFNFADFLWQDVQNIQLKQGFTSSEIHVETVAGRTDGVTTLDKDQARRAYAVAQQYEQEWREKRRVRKMEEDRAKAGGVYMGTATAPSFSDPAPAPRQEDPVARLAKAKAMLEQGLISEAEYETVKAKILAAM